jgi:hypothetical protein
VCTGIRKEKITGQSIRSLVSTSYVERQNLSMRMGMRRFTRLTNGFSKKVENLAHAVSLHYMHYNFARPHKTLTKAAHGYPTTPAMAAGAADHVWSLADIVGSARLARIAACACAIRHPVHVPDAKSDLPSVDRLAFLVSGELQDDDVGLWEVVWRLNTLAPAAPLGEKILLARHAVSSLLGHNHLWRGDWHGGPVALLTEDEMQILAHDDAPWHDPENATLLVWIREEGATPRAPVRAT